MPPRQTVLALAAATLCLALPAHAQTPALAIRLSSDTTSLTMGHTAAFTATVTQNGAPAAHVALWAYRNGGRWGAPAHTDAAGHATFLIPLPNPGPAEIEVASAEEATARAVATVAPERWIWASTTADGQSVYLQRSFSVSGTVSAAQLLVTGDDGFEAYINGAPATRGATYTKAFAADLTKQLHAGANTLTVSGHNALFSAGVLVRLTYTDSAGAHLVVSDSNWRVFTAKPAGWPQPAPNAGSSPATVIAGLGSAPWPHSPSNWPGMGSERYFPVDLPMPAGVAAHSNLVRVNVTADGAPKTLWDDPNHQVGMAFSNWFTPQNAHWDAAEAVPLLGSYCSYDSNVLRQQLLWASDMGVNFLYLDWSNTLWGKATWADRFPGADELMASTAALLDTMVALRAAGVITPRICLLLGQYNGEAAQPAALDGEMQAVYDTLVAPAKYQGLWEIHQGKPLILILETSGKAYLNTQAPLADTHFTHRYLSTRLDKNHQDKDGFWSWMDSSVHPVATVVNGKPEALTVTPAFFGDGGWTYPQAVGRKNGSTYVEEFKTALSVQPQFLLINQWNEFLSPANGAGFGANHDQFYDTYSPELSDDIEPTSLTEPGYRGSGGWGFTYLNLTRALLQLYRGQASDSTVVTVASPLSGSLVTSTAPLTVVWDAINSHGTPGGTYTLLRDGVPVAGFLKGDSYRMDLRPVKPGRHTLTIRADRSIGRFPLSATQEDIPLTREQPAEATITIDYEPK